MEHIIKWLEDKGYQTVSKDFYSVIAGWDSWYQGNVKNFHNYKVYNGKKDVKKQRKTLSMAKAVCEDMGSFLMNEKVAITIDDEKTQEFIDQVFKDNNFYTKINEFQEFKSALGTVAYVPYLHNASYDLKNNSLDGGEIRINFLTAEDIYPLSWHNGIITECAFATHHSVGKKAYVHLQIYTIDKTGYVINNKLFDVSNNGLKPVPLTSVDRFSNIAEKVSTGSMIKPFVIDRLAIANNFDKKNPLGIPLFANAISVLQGIDLTYDSLCNEFELGRKRIFVRPEMVSFDDEASGFDTNSTEFYMMPEDNGESDLLKEVNMELRIESHTQAIQTNLDLLSEKVGFGKGYYIYDKQRGAVTTATQVISEKSDLFRTIKKHENVLESAIKQLIVVIADMGNRYMGLGLNVDAEVIIDFDDSIIEDKQAEFTRDLALVSAGAMRLDELRAKYMNETLEEAKKNLPEVVEDSGFMPDEE